MFGMGKDLMAQTNASTPVKNIVLVHGAFVDGSTWRGVYDLLKQDGYNVAVVQNPTLSLEGDAAATRRVIDAREGPVVLVGHSYGGAVITEAGTDPKVAALVYIAAFAPDEGESVKTLNAKPSHSIQPPKDGFVFQDREKFPASFGADLKPELAAFMADSQVPWGVGAGGKSITKPAWRVKPSWYLVATEDRMIPRRRSVPCPSGPARPWSRWRAATPSTYRSQPRWSLSSSRPQRGHGADLVADDRASDGQNQKEGPNEFSDVLLHESTSSTPD
jgi:pimeloyl-ACP methyl ester carboxylesterase